MKTRIIGLLLAGLFMAGANVSTQESAENTPAPPPPCDQPEAARFDFWPGQREVPAKDRAVGHDPISRNQGGETRQVLFDGFYRHPARATEGGAE